MELMTQVTLLGIYDKDNNSMRNKPEGKVKGVPNQECMKFLLYTILIEASS